MVANAIPFAGVIAGRWTLFEVLALYWAESAVVGAFTLAKMAVVGRWRALPAGLFFVFHFGMFMFVHGIFLAAFFGVSPRPGAGFPPVLGLFRAAGAASLALALSHGLSFGLHFLGEGEYRRTTLSRQMTAPYGRIVFMHLVVLFGGIAAQALGSPLPVVLLLVAAKIALDLRFHGKAHAKS